MSQILSAANKREIITKIERILRLTTFPRVDPDMVPRIRQHLEYLAMCPKDLRVNVKFETFPMVERTTITITMDLVS